MSTPPPFAIEIDEGGGTTTIHLSGELDPESAPQLSAAIEAVPAAAGSRLVVDLAGVSFVDSSGLRVLVAAHKRFEDGGGLSVRSPQPTVARVLALSGLDEIFDVR